VFEALVGAIFLDSGYSLDIVWEVIEPLLRQYISKMQNREELLFCLFTIDRSIEHPNLNPIRSFYENGGEIIAYVFLLDKIYQ
jgi:hypothetical protein